MSVNEIRVNDKGTVFTATIQDSDTAVDISGATTKYFLLKKPDSTVATVTASFVTSGTDGALSYTVDTTTVLSIMGDYQLQAYCADASTAWHTDIYKFRVYSNL